MTPGRIAEIRDTNDKHTSLMDWFSSLTQRERKELICLLFELRKTAPGLGQIGANFVELVERLDDEYHSLKVKQ